MGPMVRRARWAALGCIAFIAGCDWGRPVSAGPPAGNTGAQPAAVAAPPAATAAAAQPAGVAAGGPLAKLFPPDLLMAQQRDVALSEAQRQAMIKALQETESALVPLQWQLREATGELEKLLDTPRVDEASALALADRITRAEGEIKRQHLRLLIRLKNQLTEAQQRRLDELRRRGP